MSRRADQLEAVRAFFFDNAPYKLLTLCVAIITWGLVQSQQVVEERVRVRIEWTMPDGLVPVEAPLESATVTVSGVQTLMRSLRPADLVLPIDLSTAREGDATVDLSERPIRGLPPEARIVSVNPGLLRVQLDRTIRRRLKVEAVVKGDPAEGYVVRDTAVTPERVDVSGPASVLRALDHVTTEDVDVAGIHEDAEYEVALSLARGGSIKLLRPGPVTVAVHVASTLRARRLDAVPVVVRGDRYAAGVPTVDLTVEGPEAGIAALRPDAVSVMVYVPDDFAEPAGEAAFGTDAAVGLRFDVLGLGPLVHVASVVPAQIHVEARPREAP